MSNYERRSIGAPFHDVGDQLDRPKPESPTEQARAIQARDEAQRRVEIDRGVAEAEARRKVGSIPAE